MYKLRAKYVLCGPRILAATYSSRQMALEEYIRQVKETWTNYTLDLVNYQNKCRLIRFVVARSHEDMAAHTVSMQSGDGMICSTSAARI